jgi:hypothetical protein
VRGRFVVPSSDCLIPDLRVTGWLEDSMTS